MNFRTWMVPALPIAAIVCAGAIVTGALWLRNNWYEWFPPPGRQQAIKLDETLEAVLSEKDWIAAGLPAGRNEFIRTSFSDDADRFESQRGLGDQGTLSASVKLEILTRAEMANDRAADVSTDEKRRVKVAGGFVKGGQDPGRAWQVFAERRVGDDQYQDLVGRCFFDAASVTVWTRGLATREQTEGFTKLIEATAERLGVATSTDLRPYIDQLAARALR
jgi:hypothetical protein